MIKIILIVIHLKAFRYACQIKMVKMGAMAIM